MTALVDGRPVEAGQSSRDGVTARNSRHPGDAVRLGLAVFVLAVALLAVQRDRLTNFERDVFRVVNDLPVWLRLWLVVVMQGGNVVAAPVVAVIALARRSRRLAFDLAVAGPLAWFAAKEVKRLVQRPRPSGLLEDVAGYGSSSGLGFVSGHTAVAVALATAAAPYLPRPWRRAAWCAAWLVGIARVYEGAHLPMDIVGGAALGWGIGALIHMLLGAPHRSPGLQDARRALERAGLHATRVMAVGDSPRGSFPFVATVGGRDVFVKLLDPEPRDQDHLYRLARFLAFRDVRDEAHVADALQQAEHEAAMTLLARSAGVRAPAIERVHRVGRQVWIVEEAVGVSSLAHAPPGTVTDDLLAEVWRQVALLHGASIAHRDLVADNIVLGAGGEPWLVDFAHAVSAPPARAFDNDTAELLVATASIAGPRRAVAAAGRTLGYDAVARARAELQPLALTAEARHRLRATPALLGELRSEVVGQTGKPLAGGESAVPRPRVSAAPLAAFATALAVLLAVAGPAGAWRAVASASWRWCGLVVLLALVALVQRAVAVVAASGRPLGLGRTVIACAVAEGAHATARGDADREASLGEYFARSGLRLDHVQSALGTWGLARWLVAGAGLVVALAAATVEGATWQWSPDAAVFAGSALLLGVIVRALIHARPRLDVVRAVRDAQLDSRRATVLLGATVAEAAATAAVVVAAAKAVGAPAPVAAILTASLAAGLVAALLASVAGTTELALAGGLVAAGLGAPVAVAVAVLARAASSWLPGALGWLVAGPLRRRLVV